MTPKAFLNKYGPKLVEQVSIKAGTNLANFKMIALYDGAVSSRLARELEKASYNEMSLKEILFQSDYECSTKEKK